MRGRCSRLPLRSRRSRAPLGALVGLVVALMVPSTALAIDEFPIPNGALNRPTGITSGPDGAIWFVQENGNKVGRITTAGVFDPPNGYDIPSPGSFPQEIVTGSDGNLWFTEQTANPPNVARINPATGQITEFPLPAGTGPDGITSGPDGAIWFSEIGPDQIGRIHPADPGTPASPKFTHFPTTGGINPGDITTGPDGRLWFTMPEDNKVGAITTAGAVQIFDRPGSDPSAIASSGASLWFTQTAANKIENISTGGVRLNEFTTTAGAGPSGITFGPDSALWFTESVANRIGRLTTGGGLTEFPVTTVSGEGPDGIVTGSDGNIWFTMKGAGMIG